jgi:hypothetical protein
MNLAEDAYRMPSGMLMHEAGKQFAMAELVRDRWQQVLYERGGWFLMIVHAERTDGVQPSCEWREDDPWGAMPGTYESACGELWTFTEGGAKENGVKFCHNCGKPVTVIPFPVPADEEPTDGVTPISKTSDGV